MNLREHYLDWPYEISLETFAKCNAACTFCPYTTLERIGTKMPDELIDSIIEELKDHPHPFLISPFKVNEPFLDKRLIPICRKINEQLPNAILRLFTNGSALTEKHIDEVATLKRVTHLWISLNECEVDKYRATMGLDFERTVANLDLLHEKKAQRAFNWPVMISRVRQAFIPNDDDNAFSAYVHNRWPLFKVHLIKRDSWLGFTEPNDPEVPDEGCSRWFELSVMATGKVSLCCMDGEGAYSIGDIRDGVFATYNAPHWRERRVKMLSRKGINPCSTCNY
jgi:Radical SAM superfamily/Iron-sulfur cluster-binding domain